jgi:hypothetical protein
MMPYWAFGFMCKRILTFWVSPQYPIKNHADSSGAEEGDFRTMLFTFADYSLWDLGAALNQRHGVRADSLTAPDSVQAFAGFGFHAHLAKLESQRRGHFPFHRGDVGR